MTHPYIGEQLVCQNNKHWCRTLTVLVIEADGEIAGCPGSEERSAVDIRHTKHKDTSNRERSISSTALIC